VTDLVACRPPSEETATHAVVVEQEIALSCDAELGIFWMVQVALPSVVRAAKAGDVIEVADPTSSHVAAVGHAIAATFGDDRLDSGFDVLHELPASVVASSSSGDVGVCWVVSPLFCHGETKTMQLVGAPQAIATDA
jgi:hypothetical protein